MLDLLMQYAVRHDLVAEPGFKAKTARRIIELGADGSFRQVLSPETKGVDYPFKRCPDLTQSEMVALGGLATHPLLSECSSVVLFTDKEDAEPDAKQLAKHAFFVERIKEVAGTDPAFRPVATALTNPETLAKIREKLRGEKAKSTDKATFLVGEAYPIDSENWWDWWRERRAELVSAAVSRGGRAQPDAEANQMVCFVTGEPTVPLRVHPKITGLGDVGGQAQVPFLGFDKEAFRSYGLEQSANAAVSEDAAYGYRAALDHLLKKSVRLHGMKVAHWFSGFIHDEDDPAQLLWNEKASTASRALNEAKKLLDRLQKGGDLAGVASFQYYALSLSGAGGRVMMRDWMTGSFEDLAKAVDAWFKDFDIAPLGDGNMPTPLLWRVMSCALSPNETGDRGIGSIKIPLWKAALTGGSIPDAAVVRILSLHRPFVITGEFDNPKCRSTLYMRMGLLKASLIRKGINMSPELARENVAAMPKKHRVAFECGCLMAVLATLQREAIPDLDAGIIQRYYGAASATPSLVLGRLIRLSQHHLAKLRSDANPTKKWLSGMFEASISEIVVGINASEALPKTFSLEQQTLFALGYYQQIAENRARRTARFEAREPSGSQADTTPDADSSTNVTA